MGEARDVKNALRKISSSERALVSAGFFKSGKGEYGEGDVFIGVTVPEQRNIARQFPDLPFEEIVKLLKDKVHECRLTALIILVERFAKASPQEQKKIVGLYLSHTRFVNNWDLVDSSARDIIGAYLFDKNRKLIYTLVGSKSLWERRIAIVATHYFIGKGELKDTWKIAALLLSDTEDLMHKATGWMLREAGKKDRKELVVFLKKYHSRMSRTMLRYAIEHFSQPERRLWLTR
jgi:3-methyladenine DNA glycosylase AlkD